MKKSSVLLSPQKKEFSLMLAQKSVEQTVEGFH